MWIKTPEEKQRFWRARRVRLLMLALFLGYTGAVLLVGAIAHRNNWARPAVRAAMLSTNALKQLKAHWQADPELLTIDIKQLHFDKLAEKRREALAKDVLFSSPDDFVPAKIRHDGQTFEVRVRLKGDTRDHWETEKWSLRVVVRNDKTLFGMKQFSLQHPKSRDYVNEWIYHQTLKREGLPALRYMFVDVVMNGNSLGIFALEEHFETRLVENNQLRDGPIVRFNEDLNWHEILNQHRVGAGEHLSGSGSYLASAVDTFGSNRGRADPETAALQRKAVRLLEAFRRGEVTTSQAFDISKLAKYLAVGDLMGTAHAASWRNSRFYYNPITSRLEPIGFDAKGITPLRTLLSTRSGVFEPAKDNYYYYHAFFFDTFFEDIKLYEEYLRQLARVSKRSYAEDLFDDLDQGLQQALAILHREFPEITADKAALFGNQAYIRSVLNPVQGIHAHYRGFEENQLHLDIANIQYLPVEVISASLQVPNESPHALQPQNTEPLRRDPRSVVEYQPFVFDLPENINWSEELIPYLLVQYRVLGTDRIAEVNVLPYTHHDSAIKEDILRQAPNQDDWEFCKIDEEARRISILPGIWQVDRNLVLPPDYVVYCQAGTTLDLTSGACIVSYGPLVFQGVEEAPILIESSDSTGQGLVVFANDRPSVLDHVNFRNLGNPQQDDWTLTGAITFYESPVTLSDCSFLNNRSEDALNVVRSEFQMHRVLFSGAAFDAFDADFTKGVIENSRFYDCANDAIDVSGSVVEVKNVQIRAAGDKGISVGENSQVVAQGVSIENAIIGIACKDLSQVTLANVTLTGCRFGLTVYQKKSEFGPGSVEAVRFKLTDVDREYVVEPGSRVMIDGSRRPANQENVYSLLYPDDEVSNQ